MNQDAARTPTMIMTSDVGVDDNGERYVLPSTIDTCMSARNDRESGRNRDLPTHAVDEDEGCDKKHSELGIVSTGMRCFTKLTGTRDIKKWK